MRFTGTPLSGAHVIDLEPVEDARGFFARSYCDDEFAEHDLNTGWPQENLSHSASEHTLRGMHLNRPDYFEEKIVRCTSGAIYDVIVDLRPDSGTLYAWFGTELSASNRRSLFVPKGCAHGFLTLAPDTEVLYRMGSPYQPAAATGFRWNDSLVGIEWPSRPRVISERDATYGDLADRLDEFA